MSHICACACACAIPSPQGSQKPMSSGLSRPLSSRSFSSISNCCTSSVTRLHRRSSEASARFVFSAPSSAPPNSATRFWDTSSDVRFVLSASLPPKTCAPFGPSRVLPRLMCLSAPRELARAFAPTSPSGLPQRDRAVSAGFLASAGNRAFSSSASMRLHRRESTLTVGGSANSGANRPIVWLATVGSPQPSTASAVTLGGSASWSSSRSDGSKTQSQNLTVFTL
mmetsp:Transcript_63063/g.173240  ORF Transcript_63063/g.173240 Transcript_63063/m.173240 type:complete len:225 (-) Transcript_63063:400-1074(-)